MKEKFRGCFSQYFTNIDSTSQKTSLNFSKTVFNVGEFAKNSPKEGSSSAFFKLKEILMAVQAKKNSNRFDWDRFNISFAEDNLLLTKYIKFWSPK